ncbi:hypothetical protein [Virgibacillus dokdonensis]|uniref:Uncharacterized protein n=1 Tax=Virgibacillus dokdonensis TaxID=302167 RepID=A0A2K9J7M4_9BACI|nr:hypothetical protein [Virgibacillus dokdonensis]AUJ26541.1 hypothetical protein A21D_03507 [Virgibacillus dokdonensis]
MQQDVNKIINHISNGWASDLVNSKKQVAILMEENERLKEEIKTLKAEKETGEIEDTNN